MTEYVSKNEVKPYRKIFDEMIAKMRKEVKENGITFTYLLVGSAKRNLVVRHHNKGFDCDYQVFIQKNKKGLNPKEIKKIFMDLFNKYSPSEFSNCEDSTSAITIKKKDTDNSKIEFSYDVVILKKSEGNTEIIRRKKDNYTWNELGEGYENYPENAQQVKGSDAWQKLRDIYLEKKENQMNGFKGYIEKKSFQLFQESINETLQKI